MLGSLFNKELKATFLKKRLQHLVDIVEFLRSPVLKNTANGCFCQMLFRHDQSKTMAYAKPILLKFLFRNENIKMISKIVKLKKNILQISCTVYVMFY